MSMAQIDKWLVQQGLSEQLWMIKLFVAIFVVLLLGFVVNRVLMFLEKKAHNTKNAWDDALLGAARRPAVWAIWVLGCNFVTLTFTEMAKSDWLHLLYTANRLAIVVLASIFLVGLIKRLEHTVVHPDYVKKPVDKTTAQAVGKLLRASVLITAALIAMQVLGYSVSGVLAFGGIGGLAVGFAAKDLLANFFGGMMIYLDRPFKVGDWVRSPDKEIEGTVENIGWRLTRIRTFDKRPLYIPNAIFNNIAVENPSRMLNRRIYETIGIRYEDIDKMESIVDEVKAMLRGHPEIDQNQTMIVNFVSFGASSLNFFIYTFTNTTDWVKFHAIKQDVLLQVSEIVARNKADMAFPTTTVNLPDALASKLGISE